MSLKQSNKSQKTSEIDNILVASEEVLQWFYFSRLFTLINLILPILSFVIVMHQIVTTPIS